MESLLTDIKKQFNNSVTFEKIRDNVVQLYIPFFHEDGDMFSVYLIRDSDTGKYSFTDFGSTLMRVQYNFDINTEHRKTVLDEIVKSNYGNIDDGRLVMPISEENAVSSLFQYEQLISKVSNITILQREVVRSMFYEMFNAHVSNTFQAGFSPKRNYLPISGREDLLVDWSLSSTNSSKRVFLFGVKDNVKAKDVTICCLEFLRQDIPFVSIAVHEDFSALSKKDQARITNNVDKQFVSFDGFKERGLDDVRRYLSAV